MHRLAAGVLIEDEDNILLVRDKYGWSLPKGSVEASELLKETAIREAKEETGLIVKIQEVAFVTEYKSQKYGEYLQVYFRATIDHGNEISGDPDGDIEEVLFVPKTDLREYLKFKPWILALEEWVREPIMKYHIYNLDIEGFYL